MSLRRRYLTLKKIDVTYLGASTIREAHSDLDRRIILSRIIRFISSDSNCRAYITARREGRLMNRKSPRLELDSVLSFVHGSECTVPHGGVWLENFPNSSLELRVDLLEFNIVHRDYLGFLSVYLRWRPDILEFTEISGQQGVAVNKLIIQSYRADERTSPMVRLFVSRRLLSASMRWATVLLRGMNK